MRDTVVIIGSGLMGSGIAACAALAGHPVALVDTEPERAEKGVANAALCIDELCENGLATPQAAQGAKASIRAASHAGEYAANALLVIEAIYENLEAKQELFADLDGVFPPEVPIVSNTSGLRITDIAARMAHPQRTATAHFWFPAHLVPLVEVVVGDRSDVSVAQSVRDLLLTWGKAAILVKKDLPGQLANRILQAVIREAVNIVEIGLASPEDVDTAIKMGMGIRLPVWGPLEHIDAVGLDLGLRVQDTVLPEISGATEAAPVLRKLVEENHLGVKTGTGFYDWGQKDIAALQKLRNDFIISAIQFIRNR